MAGNSNGAIVSYKSLPNLSERANITYELNSAYAEKQYVCEARESMGQWQQIPHSAINGTKYTCQTPHFSSFRLYEIPFPAEPVAKIAFRETWVFYFLVIGHGVIFLLSILGMYADNADYKRMAVRKAMRKQLRADNEANISEEVRPDDPIEHPTPMQNNASGKVRLIKDIFL